MKQSKRILVFCISCCYLQYVLGASILQVSTWCSGGNQDGCVVLTDALKRLNSNEYQVLNLSSGTHRVTDHVPISNLSDVSITGAGEDKVVVTCDEGIGLSFVNITGLILEGLTVNGCGLTGVLVDDFLEGINGTIQLWFIVPRDVRYAVLVGNCWNVTFSSVHVTNTTGLGLLGINVMGESILNQVNFTHNVRPSCIKRPARYPFIPNEDVFDQIGGGAYFLYQDYYYNDSISVYEQLPFHSLQITRSNFSYNAECSYAGITQVNFHEFVDIEQYYLVGAGGGLSIFLAQSTYNVKATVTNSTFFRNDARYGGGAHIAGFSGDGWNQVYFHGCLFKENGVGTTNISYSEGGAGLAIFLDLFPPSLIGKLVSIPEYNITTLVEVSDTMFISNQAKVEGGGLMVYSLFLSPHRATTLFLPGYYTMEIYFLSCIFLNNSAQYGAAAYIYQNANEGLTGAIYLILADINITESKAHMNLNNFLFQQNNIVRVSSALALINVKTLVGGIVECSDNEVTGLLLSSTVLVVDEESQLLVERNSGHLGGGIHFRGRGSFIAMYFHSTLRLHNNNASIYGGGIYASPDVNTNDVLRPVDQATGCVLTPFPGEFGFSFDLAQSNISVQFAENSAPTGSVVYGSTLENCTWTKFIKEAREGESIYQILFEGYDEFFSIDTNPNSSEVVSTPPVQMTVFGPGGNDSIAMFPGQSLPVNITIYDDFNHVIPATATSQILNQSIEAKTLLGDGRYFFSDGVNTIVELTVFGKEEQEFEVFFTELNTLVSTNMTVSLMSCILGFMFRSDSCVCDEILRETGVTCELSNFTLVSSDGLWVGNIKENASNEDLVVDYCHLSYCDEGDKYFRPPDYDKQCRAGMNRTGVLCGGCRPGFSVLLGRGVECRKCSNWYLLLIPLFAVLGIVLFLAIALLELTIEKGWVYTIFLYCNLITITPISLPIDHLGLIYAPIYLLSFELGIDVCLFDGMTAIGRTYFKLLFPIYLFILMFIFTLVNKKITISSNFSPIKTFMTISIMSYSSILDTSVEVVSGTTISTLRGENFIRWLIDPNIVYFSGLHTPLMIVICIVIAAYLIPVPIIMLAPRAAYRFAGKLSPVWDTLWAPFKLEFRFWLGVRLLLRSILFFSIGILPSTLASILFCALVLLVTIEVQLSLRPFKEAWVNIVDSVLLGGVLALVIGVFFFKANEDEVGKVLYTVGTILFGYGVIAGVLAHHFIAMYKLKSKCLGWCSFMKKKKVTQTEINLDSLGEEPSAETGDEKNRRETIHVRESDHATHSSFSSLGNFIKGPESQPPIMARLRESLLED